MTNKVTNKVNISFDKPFDYSIFIPYNCGRLAITQLHLTKHQIFPNQVDYNDMQNIVTQNGYETDNKSAIIGINRSEVFAMNHHDHIDRMYLCNKQRVFDYIFKTSNYYEDDDLYNSTLPSLDLDSNKNIFILFELVQRIMNIGKDKYSLWCNYNRIQMSKSFYLDANSKSFKKFEDCYNISRVCRYDHECNLNDCTTLKWRTIK